MVFRMLAFAALSLHYPLATHAEEMKAYFGNLHSHTSYSDGSGLPDEAYRHAREFAELDFLAITEHNHASAESGAGDRADGVLIANDPTLYNGSDRLSLIETAKRHTVEEEFVALYGQEFSSISKGNHVNVFDAPQVIDVPNGRFDRLLDWLDEHRDSQGERCVVQFNHPILGRNPSTGYGRDDFADEATWVRAMDEVVELIEVINGPAMARTAGHEPAEIMEEDYLKYLNLGFHVAPTADQDNHYFTWGSATEARTGVIAASLTKENVLQALRKRHVYASEDRNLRTVVRVNGHLCGDRFSAPQIGAPLDVSLTISDDDEPSASYEVEVFIDRIGGAPARPVASFVIDTAAGEVDTEWVIDGLHYGGGQQYLFLKLTQVGEDGRDDRVWTAPVWLEPSSNEMLTGIEAVAAKARMHRRGEAVDRPEGAAASVLDDLFSIALDANGRFTDRQQVVRVIEAIRTERPTDVVILAHGWNNSRQEAIASYHTMLELMRRASTSESARRGTVKLLSIGVTWPSKAWAAAEAADADWADGAARRLAVFEAFPSDRSPQTHLTDVSRMEVLLDKKETETTEADLREAVALMHRYSIPPSNASRGTEEDKSVFDLEPRAAFERMAREEGRTSMVDWFRVFTFWQMKKRAGIVGATDTRALLDQVMHEDDGIVPRIHLVGHSFGAKVVLAAVAQSGRAPLPRAVDSIVLIQPAISAHALSERVPGRNMPGGYHDALQSRRVKGPIVVTYTDRDLPLTWAYPLGARLAGQTGELESAVSPYSAMGAVGTALDETRHPRVDVMRPVGTRYTFASGKVYSVRGTEIAGHTDYQNEAVAWLLWNSLLPGSPDAVVDREVEVPHSASEQRESELPRGIRPLVVEKIRQANRRQLEALLRATSPERTEASPAPLHEFAPSGAPTLKRTEDEPPPGARVIVGNGRHVELEEQKAIERIVGSGDFLPAFFLEQGAKRQQAVGRISLVRPTANLPPGTGWGTGFMVSGTLLMTNNHVIPSRSFATRVELQMNYQSDFDGRLRAHDPFEFDTSEQATFLTDVALDYSLVRVKPKELLLNVNEPPRFVQPGERWGFLRLDYDAVLYSEGKQLVNIVQHPRGRPKEVVVHDNLLSKVFEDRIHYQADTEPASSGSPVFNNSWELIGLHHAGGEQNAAGEWLSNEAIRLDRIIEHLRLHAPLGVQTELGL